MSKTKEVSTEEKVPTKNLAELLSVNSTKGEKLSGVLRLMGEADDLRNDKKRQSMLNIVSKTGKILAKKTNEEILADPKLVAIGGLAGKNFGLLKSHATNENLTIPTEFTDAYKTLLSYGKKGRVPLQDISEDFVF